MARTAFAPRAYRNLWGVVTGLGVVAGYVAVLAANSRHFYTDDTEAQYGPLWVALGHRLREGRFPALVPWEWMSGNYTMEEAGIYNPPQLLVDLIAPSVDNLAAYVTVVKLVYSILAALGVFRICLAYGARAPWAAVAGVAFPLSGWFLFFDEASWATSLAGTAWMLHAWAASVRYTRGRGGPIPVFVYLYLAISVQYVFPAVESGLMIAAVIAGEVVHQRRWQPSMRLAATAICALLAGLMTYLPSVLSSPVTWRGNERIHNDSFLDVPWSESLNASLPSTVPAFNGWWGYVQPLPMVYIAWFLIPALAFIDWRAAAKSARTLSGPAFFALAVLLWTAGPGYIGPLRWPARVLPMVAVALLILACVLLSRHGDFTFSRRRYTVAAALLGLLFIRSFSAAPHLLVWHVLASAVVAGLGAAAVWLARRYGTATVCAFVLATMFPIAYAQVYGAPQTPMSYNFPERRSEMTGAFPDFGGVTLQLADRALVQPREMNIQGAWGSLAFGNYAKNMELRYVNAYTPIGHAAFSALLCMGWDGSTCPDAYRRAFSPEPSTGQALVDLMKVDRVVLQRAQYPDARGHSAPAGWHWADYHGHENYIWVLERDGGPVSQRDGLIAATENATATSESRDSVTSRLRVSATDGGSVVLARLAWPGYRATLDGQPVDVKAVAGTFVAVDIPAGTHDGELVITWRPPGWKIGIATALLGLTGLGILQWAYRRPRRSGNNLGTATPEPAMVEQKPLVDAMLVTDSLDS
ncbi:hypothetical protein GPX89_12460 [Nocardia sp. ET3-3]|uniref:YfhO family protein n=1 Tax=Nocardia terrae TaxID=2675851 RepID=A0A7K1UUL9_9NOCA|nr:hypothetical protein [Nocardia terrae]